MRGKKSARNLNLYLEIREEIKQIKTTLKHYEHINNRLVEELKEKDAIISNLQNTHSRRIKAALKRARDRLLFLFYGNKVHLFVSYLKLVCSLFLLFLKTPKKFLCRINPSSMALFFAKLKRMHPQSLEYEVRAKLNVVFMQGQEADAPDNYFHMLSIQREAMRVLVVDRCIPTHDKTSGALRMFSILNILNKKGCRITFIPDDLQSLEPYVSDLTKQGIEVICGNVNLEAYFKENGPRFELVILSEPQAAISFMSLVRAYAVNATLVYDTVDLHWVRLERAAEVTKNPEAMAEAEYFRKTEHFLIECADIIFTVTQKEKDFLLKINPELDVYVVPNVHDAMEGDVVPFSQRNDLMFIGHFLHQPNVDAMLYFVREVFPILRQRLGPIRLYIVGSNPTAEVLGLQSEEVVVTGYVPNVTPYFEKARVFIAPLRFGAGMKGKIGQSMSFGLPIVTTNIGAEGMGLEDGKHVLIADLSPAFADAVVRLYSDEELWQILSVESKNYIHAMYSTSTMESILSEILEHIMETSCCRQLL